MKNCNYNHDRLLAACGICIEEELSHVKGRVLEAPKVNFIGFKYIATLTSHIFHISHCYRNFNWQLKVGGAVDVITTNGCWDFTGKVSFFPISC